MRDSYVDITDEAIKEILRYGPKFVEAGAGTGYHASVLEKHGADVICYDKAPPDNHKNEYFRVKVQAHHQVHPNDPNDHSYVNQGDRTLILIWPPKIGGMSEEILRTYNGKWFIYVGQERNGATAEAKFFDLLEERYLMTDRIPMEGKGENLTSTSVYRRKWPEEEEDAKDRELCALASRSVISKAEQQGAKHAEYLATQIATATVTAASIEAAHGEARDTMERICKGIHRGALQNILEQEQG